MDNRKFLPLLCVLLTGGVCAANAYGTSADDTEKVFERESIRYVESPMETRSADSLTYADVTLNPGDDLASALGEDINSLDSLVVRGSVDEEDFRTLWEASFHGRLSAINLQHAQIADNRIPESAFLNLEEQMAPDGSYIKCITLRHIMLPEGLEEIGEGAFAYAIKLETVDFPSTLLSLGRDCFSDCVRLGGQPLVLPERITEIPVRCFMNCKSLGSVVMPDAVRIIRRDAFIQSGVTDVRFSENLEEIESWAFLGCTRLREVILPNSCLRLSGDAIFECTFSLEKIRLPEGLSEIPKEFLDNSLAIERIDLPASVTTIGPEAFRSCESLKTLNLSQNLETIEKKAMYFCEKLTEIVFPETLKTVGSESCQGWQNVKFVCCKAPVPPVCVGTIGNPAESPFAYLPASTTLYVPKGSGDLYKSAFGWNVFSEIVETDDFSSVERIYENNPKENRNRYDMLGRPLKNSSGEQPYIQNGKKYLKGGLNL